MKIFQNFILIFLSLVFNAFAPVLTLAQDVHFEATVSETTVAIGDVVQLNLTLHGVKSSSPVQLPELDGFDVQYVGPSTRVSIINGQYASSVTYVYNLLPLKEGRFQIPSLNATVDGQPHSSDPIDIEVTSQGQSTTPPSMSGASNTPATNLEDRLFIRMSIPPGPFYVNEKIPVTIKLFINGLSVQDVQYPQIEQTGFVVDDYVEPRQYQDVVGGIRYDVVEFQTSVYPLQEGQMFLGSVHLNCNILTRANHRRSGFDSFFDDDFFGSVLGSYQRYPVTLEADAVSLTVSALPSDGKPEDFTGAVGVFNFNVSASPLEVSEGDPITVKMMIAGDGNLKGIKLPSFKENEGFKVYDPQVKDEDGNKVIEQVLIPKSDQVKEIPAIHFSYFDSNTKAYRTIIQGPLVIAVKKSAAQPFKVIESQKEPASPEALGRDIIFIRESPGKLRPLNRHFYQGFLFYGIILLSLGCWGAIGAKHAHDERLKSDAGFARRLQAPKKARVGLKMCQTLLERNKPKEFYDAVFKTLQEYLADKFHLPMGNITVQALQDKIKNPAAGAVLHKLKNIFEACEAVRYASAVPDKTQMQAVYQQTQEVIDRMERSV